MLIKSIDEVRKYLPVNITSNVETIEPYIRQAEKKYIKHWLGETEYTNLESDYQANADITNMAQKYQDLLPYVQQPLINLAYLLGLPFLQLQIDDSGIYVRTGETKKSAFPDQIYKLERQLTAFGHDGIDDMLKYLEGKKTTYSDWASSPAYTRFKNSFIQTADQFSDIFNINNSRRTLLAFKDIIKRVEEDYVLAITCQDLFDEMKTQIKSNSLSSKNEKLMPLIRKAVVFMTVYKAISEKPVVIDDFGISVNSIAATGDKALYNKTPASLEILRKTEKHAYDQATHYLEELKGFLNKNADTYPLFKNSDCFERSLNTLTNEKDSGHYKMM